MATITARDKRGRLFQVDISKLIPAGTRFRFEGLAEPFFVVPNAPEPGWPCEIRWGASARRALAESAGKGGEG